MKLLVDHGCFHNLGDTAMLEGVVGALRSLLPDAELHVADRPGLRTQVWSWPRVHRVRLQLKPELPRSYRYAFSLPFVWRFATSMIRKAEEARSFALLGRLVKPTASVFDPPEGMQASSGACEEDYDGLHVVGGGNLTDLFPPEVWRRCCLMQAFARRKKPILLTGQQLGPFHGGASTNCFLRTIKRASFVGLREPTMSVDLCKRAGIAPERYAVMGDDSFGLKACPAEVANRTLANLGLKPFEFIAINLRVAFYASGHDAYLDKISELLRGLYESLELPLLVVPIAFNDCDDDVLSGQRLREACPGVPLTIYQDRETSPALTKGLLGCAYGAVGVSYHFCTFALSQGVPAVCLYDGSYYTQKAEGLKAFWADSRLAIALSSMSCEEAKQAIIGVWQDEGLRERLVTRANEASRNWMRRVEEVVAAFLAHR